jgi:hypothetical protein
MLWPSTFSFAILKKKGGLAHFTFLPGQAQVAPVCHEAKSRRHRSKFPAGDRCKNLDIIRYKIAGKTILTNIFIFCYSAKKNMP